MPSQSYGQSEYYNSLYTLYKAAVQYTPIQSNRLFHPIRYGVVITEFEE